MHDLLAKTISIFLLGALFMFGILWFTPQLLGYKQSPINSNILGAESSIDENSIKGFVQTTINVIISHFTESDAVAPLVQTTQSVQKAVTDIKTLPDTQKAAICKEICAK